MLTKMRDWTPPEDWLRITTIDAHTGGEPFRIITGGLPDVGAVPGMADSVEVFDTTLRDGAQFEGISLTVEDKLRVAEQLDWLESVLSKADAANEKVVLFCHFQTRRRWKPCSGHWNK